MRTQRGMTLVEALVSLAITALSLAAVLGAQLTLREHADAMRQQAEAVRLAQAELERLRAFADQAAFAAHPKLPAREAVSLASNTAYTLERTFVEAADTPAALATQVRVHWTDRHGRPAGLALWTMLAGVDPGLSGRLAIAHASASRVGPNARATTIPSKATDLGDGRSALMLPGAPVAWVFDNTSGQVSAVCNAAALGSLTADALTDCSAVAGWLVSGHVRFATAASVDASDALHPGSTALPLDMVLTLTEGR